MAGCQGRRLLGGATGQGGAEDGGVSRAAFARWRQLVCVDAGVSVTPLPPPRHGDGAGLRQGLVHSLLPR